MFVAYLSGTETRIEAAVADRTAQHVCPSCLHLVILVRGKMRRPHFRHEKSSKCLYAGETWQHEQAKGAILDGARARGLTAEAEVPVLSVEGDRRADVLIWSPETDKAKRADLRRLAFEVQHSSCDPPHLLQRTRAYMAAGVPLIWIPVVDQNKLVDPKRGKELFRVVGPEVWCARAYSLPSWIGQIAAIHSRLWIYVPQTGAFWRAWLLPHWLYKQPSDWEESDGGGYFYKAKIMRDMYLTGPFSFSDLSLLRINSSHKKVVSPSGQQAFLVELLPSAQPTDLACPVQQNYEEMLVDGHASGFWHYVERRGEGDDAPRVIFEAVEALPAVLSG